MCPSNGAMFQHHGQRRWHLTLLLRQRYWTLSARSVAQQIRLLSTFRTLKTKMNKKMTLSKRKTGCHLVLNLFEIEGLIEPFAEKLRNQRWWLRKWYALNNVKRKIAKIKTDQILRKKAKFKKWLIDSFTQNYNFAGKMLL